MPPRHTRSALGAVALSVVALGLPTAASADVEAGAGRYSVGGPTAPIGPGNRVLQTFVTPAGNPIMRDFTIGGLTVGGFVRVAIFPTDVDGQRVGADVWAEPNVMVDTNGWAVANTGTLVLDPTKIYAFEVTSTSARSIGSTPMAAGDLYVGGSLFTDSGSGPIGSSFDLPWQATFGFGRFDTTFQDFGTQPVGTLSPPRRFTFQNESDQDVVVQRVHFGKGGDRDDFVVVGDDCAGTKLAPGGQCDFGVRFAPVEGVATAHRQASLWLDTDHGPTTTVEVSGNAGALPAGPKGDAGADGAPGATGPTGATGATGATGPAGATGATGATGAAGSNGADGKDGATGAAGSNGVDGKDGATGAAGSNGADGKDGAAGPSGKDGVAGSNGKDGKDGGTGKDGARGAAGEKGAAGPKGDAGGKGEKGDAGQKGDRGANDVYVCTVKGTSAPRASCYLRVAAPKAATTAQVQIRRRGKIVKRATRRIATSGDVRLPGGLKAGRRYRVRVVFTAAGRKVGTLNTIVVAR